MMRFSSVVTVLCALVAAPATRAADESHTAVSDDGDATAAVTAVERPPRSRISASTTFVLGYNPVAIMPLVGIFYRNTYGSDDNPLVDGAYGELGLSVSGGPAIESVKVHAEWQPLKLLILRAQYELLWFPGWLQTDGIGLHYDSKDAAFDTATNAGRADDVEMGLAHRLTLSPTLRFKLGPVVFSNDFLVHAWYVHGRDGFWYDFNYDTLVRQGSGPSFQFADRAHLLVQFLDDARTGLSLLAGIGNEFVYSFDSQLARERVSAELIFSPGHDWWIFDDPTVIVAPSINLVDKYRQYQFSVALVLMTRFDLWRSN